MEQRLRIKALAEPGRCKLRRDGLWRNGPWRNRPWRNRLWRNGPWRGAFGATLAFTLFFSLYPHEAVQETFSDEVQAFDWLFHSLCYAALSATWLLGRAKRPRGILPRFDSALAFASLGCALELAQALLPFVARTCTLSDASANALGAVLGAFLCPLSGKAHAPSTEDPRAKPAKHSSRID